MRSSWLTRNGRAVRRHGRDRQSREGRGRVRRHYPSFLLDEALGVLLAWVSARCLPPSSLRWRQCSASGPVHTVSPARIPIPVPSPPTTRPTPSVTCTVWPPGPDRE